MSIQIPTINTLFRFSECIPANNYLKREEYLDDFLASDRGHIIDDKIVSNAELECDFEIPYHSHHVHKIDDETYQIHIWEEGIRFPFPKPDRIIDVKVIHVLAFMGRYFKLGEEVEVES